MLKFRFSYLQAGTINHSSKKLTKSNPFRLYRFGSLIYKLVQ